MKHAIDHGKPNLLLIICFAIGALLSGNAAKAQVPAAPSGLSVSSVSSTGIELTWSDNATNETGFQVERSLSATSGFESFAILSANATYLLDNQLESGTTYHYRVSAINASGASAFTAVSSATTDDNLFNLPYYWTSTDIDNGSLPAPGTVTYNRGEFAMKGTGELDVNDEFFFVYQPMQGDGEIVAQMSFSQNAPYHVHGLIIKESLDPDSKYVANQYFKNQERLSFVTRGATGESPTETRDDGSFSDGLWLKLARSGNVFIASHSEDGEQWTELNRGTVAMNNNVLIGMAAYSNDHSRFTNGDPRVSSGRWKDTYVSQATSQLAPPTNLEARISPTNELTLNWTDNSANETGFRIERALKSARLEYETIAEVGPNSTSYTEDGLPADVYNYRVRAVNDAGPSFLSNETDAEVFSIPNIVLFMQRRIGDEDETTNSNTINVTTTEEVANNQLRHPGMIGKHIDVTLATPISSTNGAFSLKVIPHTHQQTVDFFTSPALTISQVHDQLSITANGIESTYDVVLDSVTCNHIVLNFDGGDMTPYVNGTYFAPVTVGSFTVGSFSLQEYNGLVFDVLAISSVMDNDAVYEQSERCTNGVAPTELPRDGLSFRNCRVYNCIWEKEASDLQIERKRAKLITVDILFDKNTFDVGMYLHKPDLKSWLKRERNLGPGFEYYSLNRILTKKQANTSYLIHENFHGYQVPLLKGGKWFAEASADWAIWNYYREPLRGYAIAAFTLNPHMGIFEQFPGDSENYHRVVRFYHSSVILAYITSFLADESLIGRLYNEPFVERNAFITLANVLEEQGYDFDQEYGEFAARTAAWDYPNPQYSDDFERWERRGLVAGLPDHRFVDVFSEVGTYGIYQRVPGEFQPGAYGWNAYRIDSTAAGMYTVKLKGNEENPETTGFVAKIVKGTKGNYEYIDLPVSADIAQGNGEAQVEVEVSAGEQLFLVVTATDRRNTAGMRFAYEYAIGSSEHILPDDHIRNFVLEEETGFATIDHENFTVLSVVERGTDLSSLVPNVELSPGASSVPVTGDQVNFTDLVSYQVTGTGSAAKEWLVRVRAVPDRTDTDILSFELKDLVPFHTIDKENHTVSINLVNDVNLSSVEPIFTLSEGATSSPELGATIDLTSPVVYTITAEDGVTTQEWTISTKPFTPFITAWEVAAANESIPIVISEDSDYNFQYTWKNSAGSAVAEGVHTSADGDFVTSLPAAGSYTLEISGNYTHFRGYPRDNLTDILQWGDIPWTSMVRSFTGYQGTTFSATDVPDLSRVTSMFGVFEDAKDFNGDLSQWDVSSVENMDQAFEGTRVFNSDISGWDVRSLESAFRMFREAIAFNADISEWNTSNLRDMGQMFRSARSFNQNLGNWDMRKVTTIASGLGNLSPQNYDRTLIGWSTQNVREDVEVGAGGRKYCDADDARSFLINERSWTITGDTIACPEGGGTNILLFELADQSRPAKFNDDSLTVTIEVFGDVDQSTLQPVLTLSSGATSSPASEEVVDFSNSENVPVIYTVTASDGVTQQDWSVTVLKGASRPVVEEEIEDFVRNPESEEIIVIEEGTLAAYPNPTDDGTFTVDLDVYADKEEIAMGLFDSSGSAVPFRFSRDVSGRFLTINFNETEGIYYLHMKITMDEEWFEYEVIKVIKE